jgi:hypothetical protein
MGTVSGKFLCSTFVTVRFLLCGVVSPTPNPQPGGPGYPFFVWVITLDLSTSSICYHRHSSQGHVTTQAPPLRQSRGTFGRDKMQLHRSIYYSKSALHFSGDVFAHHQEHLTVFKVSGSVHPSCCWLVS